LFEGKAVSREVDLIAYFALGTGSIGLCGISYKKFFKIPKRPLFVTFCIGDYKSLAAIATLPQWPVRPCFRLRLTPFWLIPTTV
jgi:hypothetical protein